MLTGFAVFLRGWTYRVLLLAGGVLVFATPEARADWINLSGAETAPNIAEITVYNDLVHVALEIYIDDLTAFAPANASGDEFGKIAFRVLADENIELQASLIVIEPRLRKDRFSPYAGMIDPRTMQRVPAAPEDKRVIYVELEFPFHGRPDTLTFIPPLDDNGNTTVTIGFLGYHKTVPINDFRYLSRAETLMLDWEDPWYTAFENKVLNRHHRWPMMSFLYVETREVRHEALLRVRDLLEWTDLGLSGSTTLSAEDRSSVKEMVHSFFAARNPLTIDGMPSVPSASRVVFLKITPVGIRLIEAGEPVELSSAIVGVSQSHWTRQLPQDVTVEWNLFNDRVEAVPSTVTDLAGPFPNFVTADNTTILWKNFLNTYEEPSLLPVVQDDGRTIGIPMVSLAMLVLCVGFGVLALRPRYLPARAWVGLSAVCAVAVVLLLRVTVVDVKSPLAGPPGEVAAALIANDVLTNASIAFMEKDPAALDKALEVIISSEQFEEVADDLRRAFAIKLSTGGIARVESIVDLTLENTANLDDAEGFRTLANWTAHATARHWGHIDQRAIRFRAIMELAEIEGAWKLTGLTVVDVKPLE